MVEAARHAGPVVARRLRLRGHVQGVGFRPFVYRIASEHGINGHVQNRLGEVEVVAAGAPADVERFKRALIEEAPPLSSPELIASDDIEIPPTDSFAIIASAAGAEAQVVVPPSNLPCGRATRLIVECSGRIAACSINVRCPVSRS